MSWITPLSLLVFLMTGCALRLFLYPPVVDCFYDVTVVNRTGHTIRVSVTSVAWTIEPCTVHHEVAISGPLRGEPVPVQAEGLDGTTVYSGEVEAEESESGPALYVEIPGAAGEECPVDKHDVYTLTFTNLLDRPIRIMLGDAYLGRLFSGESGSFGPMAGDWQALPKIVLRDRNDVQMQLEDYFLSPAPIIFRLGDTPEIQFTVTAGY